MQSCSVPATTCRPNFFPVCVKLPVTRSIAGFRARDRTATPLAFHISHVKLLFLIRSKSSRVLSQPLSVQHSRQGRVPSAVTLSSSCTSFWGQVAHLSKWRNSGDTPCVRSSAGVPCFLPIRQQPPGYSLLRRDFSSQQNQLGTGRAGFVLGERELIDKDKLILRGLQFHGFHGVKQEEKTLGQKFVVDVDAWMDLSAAGETDSISDTVSYTDIYRIVKDVVEGPSHNLLESVAHRIARAALFKFPQISAVRVKVGKPQVAVQGIVDYLGVEILRYRKDMGGDSSGAPLS